MDIGSRNRLSVKCVVEFSPHSFVIDGVECASMEGFSQSLKFSIWTLPKACLHVSWEESEVQR